MLFTKTVFGLKFGKMSFSGEGLVHTKMPVFLRGLSLKTPLNAKGGWRYKKLGFLYAGVYGWLLML